MGPVERKGFVVVTDACLLSLSSADDWLVGMTVPQRLGGRARCFILCCVGFVCLVRVCVLGGMGE